MSSRCNGAILLGAVAISIVLAVMEPDINVRRPYGSRMCQRLCNWISGCSSYIYRTSDLSCDVTPTTLRKQNPRKEDNLINVIKDNKRKNAGNAENCTLGERVFYTRRNIVKCRPILSRYPIVSNKEEETIGTMTRILVYPVSDGKQQPLRQIYLGNNSVADYPFADDKHITAVAYIPSQSKLVMSTSKPQRLIFIPIDSESRTVIKTKQVVTAIAIDDHKNLMFIIEEKANKYIRICAMSTHGKKVKSLYKTKAVCLSSRIAADRKRSLIYFYCTDVHIYLITYQGDSKGTVAECRRASVLYIHGDDLYYQKKANLSLHLHTLSLSDQTVTAFRTQTKLINIDEILVAGNIAYTYSRGVKGAVFATNLIDMSSVAKIKIGMKSNYIAMCFIP